MEASRRSASASRKRQCPQAGNRRTRPLAIERYRDRYEIDSAEPTALGTEPPPGQFEQRRDRKQVAEQVLGALRDLGREAPQRGPLEERIRETPGLAADEPEQDRTLSWEL